MFGALLLLGVVLGAIASFDPLLYSEEYINSMSFRVWDLMTLLAMIVPIVAFMYDGYVSAVNHNEGVKKKSFRISFLEYIH